MTKVTIYSGLERREQLMRFTQTRERVTIEELCDLFNISPATARRDLQLLADEGKLRRFHGGAIAAKSAPPNRRLSNAPAPKQQKSSGSGRRQRHW